jgi:hypothetical protein
MATLALHFRILYAECLCIHCWCSVIAGPGLNTSYVQEQRWPHLGRSIPGDCQQLDQHEFGFNILALQRAPAPTLSTRVAGADPAGAGAAMMVLPGM